jgi:hypothetical protein
VSRGLSMAMCVLQRGTADQVVANPGAVTLGMRQRMNKTLSGWPSMIRMRLPKMSSSTRRRRLLNRPDVLHQTVLHVEHLLVGGLIVPFAGEQVIAPDRHVTGVGPRAVELPVDDPKDFLRRKCSAVTRGDVSQIGRMSGRVRRRGTIAGTIGSMAVGAQRLEEPFARIVGRRIGCRLMHTRRQGQRRAQCHCKSAKKSHGRI